ncbi:hypothetical protein ALC53_08951 [Atta colombica]|uniref:Uncharacterized protein n=1 Tax=Atta colombica TaxID=520822 RepID=A0A151I210_9HYME|nr:hypothetical protein ALC53_08951 [Atta colombica]
MPRSPWSRAANVDSFCRRFNLQPSAAIFVAIVLSSCSHRQFHNSKLGDRVPDERNHRRSSAGLVKRRKQISISKAIILKVISLLLLAVHHKAVESARLALGILATANSDLSAVFPNGRSIRVNVMCDISNNPRRREGSNLGKYRMSIENLYGTNTERDETPDKEFYTRDQKRLRTIVEETEEIEEIENSPVAFRVYSQATIVPHGREGSALLESVAIDSFAPLGWLVGVPSEAVRTMADPRGGRREKVKINENSSSVGAIEKLPGAARGTWVRARV